MVRTRGRRLVSRLENLERLYCPQGPRELRVLFDYGEDEPTIVHIFLDEHRTEITEPPPPDDDPDEFYGACESTEELDVAPAPQPDDETPSSFPVGANASLSIRRGTACRAHSPTRGRNGLRPFRVVRISKRSVFDLLGSFQMGCCARRFVPAARTRPRSDSARSCWWGSRQTAHAWVWAPTIAAPFYGHSDCPQSGRSCHEEILPTGLAAENPESLPPSCAAPPGPHHARGEGRKRPTTGRCHSVASGPDGGRLGDTNSVRRAESFAAAPVRPGKRPPRRGAGCDTALRCGFFYLELRSAAFTPGLPGSKPQPRFPQPAADGRTRQMTAPLSTPRLPHALGKAGLARRVGAALEAGHQRRDAPTTSTADERYRMRPENAATQAEAPGRVPLPLVNTRTTERDRICFALWQFFPLEWSGRWNRWQREWLSA